MAQQPQMNPAQINAIARAAIKARAVRREQQIFSQAAIVPANTPIISVVPQNVGLILGFWIQVTHTINNGSGVQIDATDFNAANSLSQIQFNDLNNNTRIQTTGWHLNFVNSVRGRRPYGTSFVGGKGGGTGIDDPVNYGSNWTINHCPANIAAGDATKTVTQWYWLPLAYSEDDLRGVVYANVVNATMQLNLSLPGTNGVTVCVDNGKDSTQAMFVGDAAGSTAAVAISATTINVWQVYLDQLPVAQNGVILPITDLATIYELKNTTQQNMAAGQDFGYQYPNFRDILSTVAVYVNNGTTGARGTGADINYWELLSANFTAIWKRTPDLNALQTRAILGTDLPPGVYYFDSRNKPISTTQYGNMQLVINPITATNNPYELVGVEDFAVVQTLSMAGSLQTS